MDKGRFGAVVLGVVGVFVAGIGQIGADEDPAMGSQQDWALLGCERGYGFNPDPGGDRQEFPTVVWASEGARVLGVTSGNGERYAAVSGPLWYDDPVAWESRVRVRDFWCPEDPLRIPQEGENRGVVVEVETTGGATRMVLDVDQLRLLGETALAFADLLETGEGLDALLLAQSEFPRAMVLSGEGERTADEITRTFPDPVDAAQRFEAWGWRENAYRDFAAASGDSVSVSLHRFANAQVASDAIPYFVEARRHGSDLEPVYVSAIGDRVEGIGGSVADGQEMSLFIRRGDILARVTVVMKTGDPVPTAEATATALLAKIDRTLPPAPTTEHRG